MRNIQWSIANGFELSLNQFVPEREFGGQFRAVRDNDQNRLLLPVQVKQQ